MHWLVMLGVRPSLLFLGACCALSARAQELLPNGGFEQFSLCPDLMGQIDRAQGWIKPTLGSSDYLHACQPEPNSVGAPNNLFGFQDAHSGSGYAGIICFAGPDNVLTNDKHEYVSHALVAPLVPGRNYTVSYYVNLADISRYALGDIGALFSVVQPHRDDEAAITTAPQITNSAAPIITDTDGWTRIQGCFVADSAYRYITIGNFRPGSSTTYLEVTPTWSGSSLCYYFVDDVSVQEAPRPDLGPDRTLCEASALAVLDPQAGAVYEWSTGANGTSITVDAAGSYSVSTALDACILSDTVVVSMGVPVSFSLPSDTLVDLCAAQEVLLDARPDPANADVTWSTGGLGSTATVSAAGSYMVHASAVDHCAASAVITVIDTCSTPLYAPNAFTPNGDGFNDVWRPIWAANPGAWLEFTIYDRWGVVLFHSDSQDAAWDGTANGAPLPVGIYNWTGKTRRTASGAARDQHGHLILIR
ncbi:MAG: gliding motility-associated C-terminal domain-containing protein [Flavobacteriales bacterium]|nr:gliding motility-associated C-terminal domain-containing protein [Flavobacteriales bacterium]